MPAERLRALAGRWQGKGFSLDIEPDGKGKASFVAWGGSRATVYFADFKVAQNTGEPVIAFRIFAGGKDVNFEITVLPRSTPEALVLREAAGRLGTNPVMLKRRPVAAADEWEDVVPRGQTLIVACDAAKGGHTVYGGTLAGIMVLGGGFTTALDAPGSLWLVARGGLTWKGAKFPAGSIVAVDGRRAARLTRGEYGAWFIADKETPVYATAAAGEAVATVKAGTRVRLLVPDSDSKGFHKVLLDGDSPREGYVSGAWDKILFRKRRTPTPEPAPPGLPAGGAGPALRDLRVVKSSAAPPSVEFTVRLDPAGGELLEAWASVGVARAGPTVQGFAGAVHSGLISVNGIRFAHPPPDLKVQRVSMKKAGDLYECSVRYPKVAQPNPVTEFTVAAAVMKGGKVVKTNAATVRVDLTTGKVLGGEK